MKGLIIAVMLGIIGQPICSRAQEKPEQWTLKGCIAYALEQNIQVKKSKLALEKSKETTSQTKAQLFPNLSFSTDQNLVNRPKGVNTDKNSYSANYGFNSSVTVYNGGKLRLGVKQQEVQEQIQDLYIREAENNIELAITESFLQVLYAAESVEINRNTVEVSEAQCERAKQLYEAGSISRSDLAQLVSQYSTDKYQLVTAQATLDEQKLDLKQLLELGISEKMNLVIPELTENDVLRIVPDKEAAYLLALDFMPEIKSSQLSVKTAEYDVALAKAGYLPSVNLTAGIGTGHTSGSDYSFGNQLKNSFNESVGVTLNIPIYSNRKNKTALKIARLEVEDAGLSYLNTQKELLKTVETVYLDVVSAQDRYKAALENLNAVRESYDLVQEQFDLGMKNTVEFLSEKNNWMSAQLEMIQSKYMAVLSYQLLSFYQGKGIDL